MQEQYLVKEIAGNEISAIAYYVKMKMLIIWFYGLCGACYMPIEYNAYKSLIRVKNIEKKCFKWCKNQYENCWTMVPLASLKFYFKLVHKEFYKTIKHKMVKDSYNDTIKYFGLEPIEKETTIALIQRIEAKTGDAIFPDRLNADEMRWEKK